jgi:hypothetical protein
LGVFGRLPPVELSVSPTVVRPNQTVQATVTVPMPLADVTATAVEWGYTNFYDGDGGQWVGIDTDRPAVSVGRFVGTTSTFRVPARAPGSSDEIARWLCRLRVSRRRRDITAESDFGVVVAAADVAPGRGAVHRVDGAADTVLDVALPWAVFGAGDTIRGHVMLTPVGDLPDGDLAMCWQRDRLSHPLNRPPSPIASLSGPIIKLGNRIPLRSGSSVAVPFELALPADAAPTASALHSSLVYFIAARLRYAGSAGRATERVRCPIVVVNAD